MLSREGQEFNWMQQAPYQLPVNKLTTLSKNAVLPSTLNLVDLDFKHFGANQAAKRIIERWLKEVRLSQ
ncbi:hypothetical protein K7G92_000556 [Pasteurella canis]|uniref:hypothetical protein n=1 Tax=Pasteurella canis TaxID=753 RepID=UPI001E4FD210|nr:hypothetical protein [Pasteurella canis]UEA17359.1 hypothetical protein K7G92_000556 [Pasteurella canis]